MPSALPVRPWPTSCVGVQPAHCPDRIEFFRFSHSPCSTKHQQHRDFGNRICQHVRRVQNGQALRFARRQIDMVVANRIRSDRLHRSRTSIKKWLVHPDRWCNHQCIASIQSCKNFLTRGPLPRSSARNSAPDRNCSENFCNTSVGNSQASATRCLIIDILQKLEERRI